MTDLSERPEIQLLLKLTGPGGTEQLATIPPRVDLDWPLLLEFAREHRLLPLLCQQLLSAPRDALPSAIRKELGDRVRQATVRAMLQGSELVKILLRFADAGIVAVPYKGPVLAACLYGDYALRACDDLDIVVRVHDLFKAKEVLAAVGYRPEVELSPAQEAIFFAPRGGCGAAGGAAWSFLRSDGPINVEVHWTLTERLLHDLPDREFWRRLGRVSFMGSPVLTFPPEELLLTLCAHGAKHVWERLVWICDVARLVAAVPELDWARLRLQAVRRGGWRLVCLGLHLAERYFGVRPPEPIRREVRADPAVAGLAARVHEELFREGVGRSVLRMGLFHLRSRERLRDRVRYCLETAFNPTLIDWQFAPLPPALALLQPLVRPVRLAAKYAKTLVPSWSTRRGDGSSFRDRTR